MAAAAGRRNALREISSLMIPGTLFNMPNVSFPPTPTSPEEEIIQRLGRKKSPKQEDFDESILNLLKTPTKSPRKPTTPKKANNLSKKPNTPSKYGATPTRSSPRKRLNLGQDKDAFDESNAISGMSIYGQYGKRQRLEICSNNSNFDKCILALSHSQLVDLVTTAANTSPEARQMMETFLPYPDLSSVETKLHYLQKNVGKAKPRSVWGGSQKDSYTFLRLKTHLEAFQKECLEQGRRFMDSQNWSIVLEYSLMVWGYIKCLPDFEDLSSNRIKTHCFKQVASYLATVIKKAKCEKLALQGIIERIKTLEVDSYLESCLKLAERQLQQAK